MSGVTFPIKICLNGNFLQFDHFISEFDIILSSIFVSFVFEMFISPHVALMNRLTQLRVHIRDLVFLNPLSFNWRVFVQNRLKQLGMSPIYVINVVKNICNMKGCIINICTKYLLLEVFHATVHNFAPYLARSKNSRGNANVIMKTKVYFHR